MKTVKGLEIQLFNFGDAISMSQRLPEKLIKIGDLHDTLFELLSNCLEIFMMLFTVKLCFQFDSGPVKSNL